MSRGPLPDPNAVRRNKPTIPTTKLPADGYDGEAPQPAYDLGEAGMEWWDFAWTLPQAAAWDDGAVYAASRRAQLEDDLASLQRADHLSSVVDDMIGEALAESDPLNLKDRLTSLKYTLAALKKLAGNSVGLMKEMRELDKRLGLDPKALGELRWTIVEDEGADEEHSQGPAAKVRHLRAVDRGVAA